MRPDRPAGDRLENTLPALVLEVTELGVEAVVWLQPEGLAGTALQMRLPTRVVQRFGVIVGETLTLCLRAADIVLLGDGSP